ncbi:MULTISPECIES: plasmid mobilization relaxosome protein MobC [unclassified Streptomyces]|uniref:plasmid mobilization relaxosome protein MobC n=1 Tax=unclassified Streptomyces TaxID=2593676 RepID=UPI000DC7C358|nr:MULTISPECIES: plasmid mobilization relaxosome protein MobC [unclassified Streptomyces]AWZ05677.1 plasmid mobilization relaxosome protein MobC [Streptomyces sp. ICC4]AWZ11926.1 plasmid mobilization relaxosome protein MobC [Streptomyces sp. ICC1]
MHDAHRELPTTQKEMITGLNSPARYGVGPSKGRSNAASAPGVAETEPRREGAPGQEGAVVDAGLPVVVRAADAAALYRVARRRARQEVQRTQRVDVRYSADEKTEILAEARRLGLAGAHLVGAIVMAYLDGHFEIPGQRTSHDDLIDELVALRAEIAPIGNNVNQIAFKLNSGGRPHPVDRAVLAQAERVLALARTAAEAIELAAGRTSIAKRAA